MTYWMVSLSEVLNLLLRELVLGGHHTNSGVVVGTGVEEILAGGVVVDDGVDHLVLLVEVVERLLVGEVVIDDGVEQLLVGGDGLDEGHVIEEQLLLLGEVVVEEKILREWRSLGTGKVNLKISGRQLVVLGSILAEISLNCLPLLNTGLGEPVPPDPGPARDLSRDVLPPPGSFNSQLPPVTEAQLGLPSFQDRLAGLPGLEGDEGKLLRVNLGIMDRAKLGEKIEDIFAGHAERNT